MCYVKLWMYSFDLPQELFAGLDMLHSSGFVGIGGSK